MTSLMELQGDIRDWGDSDLDINYHRFHVIYNDKQTKEENTENQFSSE